MHRGGTSPFRRATNLAYHLFVRGRRTLDCKAGHLMRGISSLQPGEHQPHSRSSSIEALFQDLGLSLPQEGGVRSIPAESLSKHYLHAIREHDSPLVMEDHGAGRRAFEKLCAVQYAYEVLSNPHLRHLHENNTKKKQAPTDPGWVGHVTHVLHPCPRLKDMPRSNWISDSVGLLSEVQKWRMNNFIDFVKSQTGVEVGVALLEDITTDQYGSLEKASRHATYAAFSDRLMDLWGVGRAGHNDGILFVLFRSGKHIQIRTGVGVTDYLSDSYLRDVQQKEMLPEFKKGNYGKGMEHGVAEVGTTVCNFAKSKAFSAAQLERQVLASRIDLSTSAIAEVRLAKDADEGDADSMRKQGTKADKKVSTGSSNMKTYFFGGGRHYDKMQRRRRLRERDREKSKRRAERRKRGSRSESTNIAASLRNAMSFLGGSGRRSKDRKKGRKQQSHGESSGERSRGQNGKGSESGDGSGPNGHYEELLGWFYGLAALGVAGMLWASRKRSLRIAKERECETCGSAMKVVRTQIPSSRAAFSKCHQLEQKLGSAIFEDLYCAKCGGRKLRRELTWSQFQACHKCGCQTLITKTKVVKSATTWSEGMKRETIVCRCCGCYEERKIRVPRKRRHRGSTSSGGGGSSGGFGGGSSGGGGSGSSW